MGKLSKNSIDYYIWPNMMMCNSVGMWPFDEEPSTWKIVFARFRLVFSVIGICALSTPELMFVVLNLHDMEIITRMGCVALTHTQLLFKMFYLLARREKAYILYNELRNLWDSTDDEKERESYEVFAYWARIVSIFFYVFLSSSMFSYMCLKIFNCIRFKALDNNTGSERSLLMDTSYGVDVTKSPAFEIALTSQVMAFLVIPSAACGIITTCGMIILHISGQFRLISTWVANIGIEISLETGHLGRCPLSLTQNLTKCIRHHQRVLHLVNEINDLLTPIIFLQILTSGVEICLNGYALINIATGMDLFTCYVYVVAMTIQFFMWCAPGQVLIQESEGLAYSVYLNIPWYKLPPIYQRYFILMILRSQRYCSISTILFEALSIHTLTIIFNTAASYFTLLTHMQEKL